MRHSCNGCGRSFDTLSALRLHDCPEETENTNGFDVTEWIERRGAEHRRDRQRLAEDTVGDELDSVIQRVEAGDAEGVGRMLTEFEHELDAALREHDHGRTYRAVFWTYLEPIVAALDQAVRVAGWPLLADVCEAYDPRADEAVPDVAAGIASIVARHTIRARWDDGVDAVPASVLTYLASIPVYDRGNSSVAWEESTHFGWAIGHASVEVEASIRDRIETDHLWAAEAATTALLADQRGAIDLFLEVFRALPAGDRPVIASNLSRLEGAPSEAVFPRFWDVSSDRDRDFEFEFNEAVAKQLRSSVDELGVADSLSEDWAFKDLEKVW